MFGDLGYSAGVYDAVLDDADEVRVAGIARRDAGQRCRRRACVDLLQARGLHCDRLAVDVVVAAGWVSSQCFTKPVAAWDRLLSHSSMPSSSVANWTSGAVGSSR